MQSLKSLFVTLLLLGGAFLAYDYYQAPRAEKVVFKDSPYPKLPAAPAVATPKPPEEKPLKGTAAIAANAPAPDVRSATVSSIPKPAEATAPAPKPSVSDFTPPPIPDVAQATQNWTRIPPTAFPRPVTLTAPIVFISKFGSTQVPIGAEVTALSIQNGFVTHAPIAQSPLRASAPIDSTNLKAVLTAGYDAWRTRRIEEAKLAAKNRKPAAAVDQATLVSADGKPVQASDGTYPLLLASMQAGQVTEVTPNSIRRWGSPEQGNFKGQTCWILPVEYDAQTAFGKISSAAMAKVVGGKVAGWFYKGSEEPVP
jgi:hypothetical protein